MRYTDVVLAVGAVARLTRFVTRDDLGHWAVKGPLERRALRHALGHHSHLVHADNPNLMAHEPDWDPDDPDTWPRPLQAASGLTCPWCVSVWIALGVWGTLALVEDRPRWLAGWRLVTVALTTSHVVGLAQSRLEDVGDEE